MQEHNNVRNLAKTLAAETKKTGRRVRQHESNEHCNSEDDTNEEINKVKSHAFIEQIQNHLEEGQLTPQDVRDEANVIVAAVSITHTYSKKILQCTF